MDLSQNELLSAYLDGELTAAEQAEVERLLATQPAARQLLDDLRSLSATLQSLPQEKLGGDLSQRVLRTAERRMLTEGPGEPELSPFAPVPLLRSVFRRFVNRRTLAWLSITAVIAVAIAINERWQQAQRAGRAVNRAEVARRLDDPMKRPERAPANVAESTAAPGEPPSMQAAPRSRAETSSLAKKPIGGKPAVTATPTAPATPPADARRGEKAVAKKKELADNAADGQPGVPVRPPLGEAAPTKAGGSPSPARQSRLADSASVVLVVHFSVAPAAFQDKAFDKLLDANGVAPHRPLSQGSPALEKSIAGRKSKTARDLKGRLPSSERESSAASETEAADTIYAEATPQQLQAVLAGLAAQPEVFLSVSTKPVEGRPAEEIVGQYESLTERQHQIPGGPRQQVQGKQAGQPAKAAQSGPKDRSTGPKSDTAVDELKQQRSAAQSPSPQREEQTQSIPAKTDANRQQQLQQIAPPSQRVLFVIRIAAPPTATATEPARAKSEPAKPTKRP